MLRFVDISGHQGEQGIDPGALDCDGVIIKVTGGDYFTNPYWQQHAERVLESGKLLAFYHYARDLHGDYSTPAIEAQRFIDAIRPYIGRCNVALDWEAEADEYPITWAQEWCDIVNGATGAKPFMYVGGVDANNKDFSPVSSYPLWLASYLYKYDGAGWVDNPTCIYGSGSWPNITMYQYTSTGYIDGFDDRLDLNVFYGDRAEWEYYMGGGGNESSAQDLINVAMSYLGTTEDDPRFYELIEYYNSHTDGYDMSLDDEWCACFVSVCSLKSGNANVTGVSVNCAVFRSMWLDMGIYRDADSIPSAGWLIDYDWQQDGIPDHIGIVVDCDGSTIHVIEGNAAGEVCTERWIPVGDPSISCFAAPNYPKKTRGDDDPMQFIYQPDGKPYLVYHDGTKNIELSDPDQVVALQDNYRRCTGRDLPCFTLGTPESPWGARFEQVFPYMRASDEWGGHAR